MRKAIDVETKREKTLKTFDFHSFSFIFIHFIFHVQSVENVGTRKKRNENMRKATDVETKTRKTLKTFDMNYIKYDTNSTNS